jgi:hypothetical protein
MSDKVRKVFEGGCALTLICIDTINDESSLIASDKQSTIPDTPLEILRCHHQILF